MRITFTITGRTADEVERNALERLREFTGLRFNEAELSITAQPLMVSGSGTVALWEANVEVEHER